ncbi:MAG: EF-P lysine aminoacylase GenX [Gammaproteobacteria bacterium]|nr:EF-P lysine aminoacylase GenX [Gammaproteobacteria bacterium]
MWQPTASLQNLAQRAEVLCKIRHFFAERHILEVETPLLSGATNPDPNLDSLSLSLARNTAHAKTYYLQTSPEFAMKRLLAAGSGPIYQICKAFRDGEHGRLHNPEFTLLEWYRPNFTLEELMTEVDALFAWLFSFQKAKRITYADLFQEFLEINPHTADLATLEALARSHNRDAFHHLTLNDKDDWLQLLMTHFIEPFLGFVTPVFVYGYPASQAALAAISKSTPEVAERFEIYMNGIEIGNAFFELTDPASQRRRFEENTQKRQQLKKPVLPFDEHFLQALEHGLPTCSGIAIGLDRLMMVKTGAKTIGEVMAFHIEHA